jgi:hypothetical protein
MFVNQVDIFAYDDIFDCISQQLDNSAITSTGHAKLSVLFGAYVEKANG